MSGTAGFEPHRLPPGQQLVAPGKWPTVGERLPADRPDPWTVDVAGQVSQPRTWSLDELRQLPQENRTIDIHCVTRWSKLNVDFRGVRLALLLDAARPSAEARFVSLVARSDRGHSTSLPYADIRDLDPLLALECEGQSLPTERGGPVRVIVPQRYFYKSLKWLAAIELLARDRLGFWEATAGYHNVADPWRQQRYVAPGLSKQEVAGLLSARDFRGRSLRSLTAAGRDLSGLRADQSLLRDADFSHCQLPDARFDGANLSNARFTQANLRRASFIGADVEGADFSGADLRGTQLDALSFLGVSFASDSGPECGAQIDASTLIPEARIEELVPDQAAYVRRRMPRTSR